MPARGCGPVWGFWATEQRQADDRGADRERARAAHALAEEEAGADGDEDRSGAQGHDGDHADAPSAMAT
ncbi:hypothetical protein GCM10020218_007290 [Dactylosporangium vinaceum]